MRLTLVLTLALVAATLAPIGGSAATNAGSAAGCGSRTIMGVAKAASPTNYDDVTGDSGGAPDFCGANIVTNDNAGTIYFVMHVPNRGGFAAGDLYGVFIDSDSNPASGGEGFEYLLFIGPGGSASLGHWDGAAFVPGAAPSVKVEWVNGVGPLASVNKADLGGPASLRFMLFSLAGQESDAAPDAGAWPYQLTPLQLAVKSLQVGQAKAGKPLAARMVVTRSDFGIDVDEGAIACTARAGTKALRGNGAFEDTTAVCRWTVPRAAKGKRITGSISVTVDGVEIKRTFSQKVR